jgi:hypothetical protein
MLTELNAQVRFTRPLSSVAAGTSVQNGTGVDMAADGGYDGVLFVLLVGTLTATQVTALKAQQSSDDAATDAYDDLAGTLTGPFADADSNKMIALDVFRPAKRYVRPVVNRATANAVLDGVVAIQYRGRKVPSIHDVTKLIASKSLVAPAEGTA